MVHQRASFITSAQLATRSGASVGYSNSRARSLALSALKDIPKSASLGWSVKPAWVTPASYSAGGSSASARARGLAIYNRKAIPPTARTGWATNVSAAKNVAWAAQH